LALIFSAAAARGLDPLSLHDALPIYVDPRPALIKSRDIKMDHALALPARRITDLLSSGLEARVKSKRQAMDQPRSDPDQELVKRTQAGDASAFDDRVVKYTTRLYGLVY